MKVVITIELGNEAMLDYPDVAEALERTALSMRRDHGPGQPARDSDIILDRNGNTVGRWTLVDDDKL